MLLKEMIYKLYGIDGDCSIKAYEIAGVAKPQFRFVKKDSLDKVKLESFIGVIHGQFIRDNGEKIKNDFRVFRELNGSAQYYFEDVYTDQFINWMVENKSEYQQKWKAFHFDLKDQSDWIDLSENDTTSVIEGYKEVGDDEYSITVLSNRTIINSKKTTDSITEQVLNFIVLNTQIKPDALKTVFYADKDLEERHTEMFDSLNHGQISSDFLILLHKKIDGELVKEKSFLAKRVLSRS